MAYWLFSFPPSIPSDDAYFFSLGVERFSVLEFRPHFPAYPGFIGLGKLLHFLGQPPIEATFYTSLIGAISLPPFAAWTANAHGASKSGVLLAFWVTLTQPFLPLVGLSMLSDSTGIAFILLGLGLLAKGQYKGAGIILGLALACRPSFLPVVAAMVLTSLFQGHKQVLPLIISCIFTVTLIFGWVILWEGEAFFYEAWRFTEGHFMVWGNTSVMAEAERPGWVAGLSQEIPATAALLTLILGAIVSIFRGEIKSPLCMATLAAVLWTVLAQNPENLRHLLLPSILISLCLVQGGKAILGGVTLVQAALLVASITLLPLPSPLEQTANVLIRENDKLIVTHHGVAYLRNSLPQHSIADSYYRHNTLSLVQSARHQHPIKIFSSSWHSPQETSLKTFKGRVTGEKFISMHSID